MEIHTKNPSVTQAEGSSSFITSIHPTAVIDSTVHIEPGVFIGPYTVITGRVTIGSGTKIYSHVTIGYPAQDINVGQSLGTIEIGKNCSIREYVSIHASKKQDGFTRIGDNCYIMAYSHISHDVVLENNVVLINNVQLGGHTYVERNAFLMANAVTHQFCRIGQYAALAPYSGIRQDLPPFGLFNGRPAHFSGLNRIALKRAGIPQHSIEHLNHVTFLFYQKKLLLDDIKTLAAQEPEWGNDQYVQSFLTFIKESTRGVSRKVITEQTEESAP